MSNPITTLPPEGQPVVVADGGAVIPVVYWCGKWRDGCTDGGWYEFSSTATWDLPGAAAPTPTLAPTPVPTPAPTKAPTPLQQADAALKEAEVAVEAAEAAEAK